MMEDKKPKPNYLWSMLTLRCPRCRRGDMFRNKNPYKKLSLHNILNMYDHCPVCRQKYELEPGFWIGTSYVSYGVMVAISAISFMIWWLIVGISVDDNRVFYWIIFNGLLLLFLQPWVMRLSRLIYLNFFVKYNENYDKEEGIKFT
ncbi:MAG TPA: DUF983 domain-containing protein [Hanamia sp.]|nr:DUF983 domain-containing protein [Hanamia sp.]